MGVFEEFQANARLTGHLEEVPGLGPTGIENLKGKGLHTTYQLIGYFLKLNRDEVAFANFLKELGSSARLGPSKSVSRTEASSARSSSPTM